MENLSPEEFTEQVIIAFKKYLESPDFLAMTKREQKTFVTVGPQFLASLLIMKVLVETITTTSELDKLHKELEVLKLEKLFNSKERK